MDGWMDRWMDGWMNGWMDGWTDRQTDRQYIEGPETHQYGGFATRLNRTVDNNILEDSPK